jgi:hypothetical protein
MALAVSASAGRTASPPAAEVSALAGTWRGQSICVTDDPACHNETVIYYVRDVPDRPDLVVIQADKIVGGKAITMGTGQWQYDRGRQTLQWRMPERVWLLEITGNRMAGTLKLSDGRIFRKITLEKAP